MKKYQKVRELEVLESYYDFQNGHNQYGLWVDYMSIPDLAYYLKTSRYQIQKAFKSLKEKGFLKIERIPSHWEEYDNGLYTTGIPILYTKAYVITSEGKEYIDNSRKEKVNGNTGKGDGR